MHDADALFFTNLALSHREGGLPLFTELPRRLILGNWASGINFTRILGASAKYKALPRSDWIRMRPAAYGFPRKLLLSVIR